MKIKKKLSIMICFVMLMGTVTGCQKNTGSQPVIEETSGDSVVQSILNSYSTREFVEGTVSDEDLELILQSGAKAPSARNMQPWHFSVVTGDQVPEIIGKAVEGNVLIIISGQDDAGEGMLVDYDCGLASAYLYLSAQSLGYGAHIYMGGVSEINETRREELGIPDGYSAVMMMLIGNIDNSVDTGASATERNDLSEMVTYIQ